MHIEAQSVGGDEIRPAAGVEVDPGGDEAMDVEARIELSAQADIVGDVREGDLCVERAGSQQGSTQRECTPRTETSVGV